jgi:hypothetical protein
MGPSQKSRRLVALVFGGLLAGLALVACGGESGTPAERAMKSAGGLPEDRFPVGVRGETPAPTGAVSADKAQEAGWLKNAKPGEKMPHDNDRASW